MHWIYLQLFFLIWILGISICESDNGSCQEIGCGSKYNQSKHCQCDSKCRSYNNCCSDYNETCQFCRVIGCQSNYAPSRPCQCNTHCRKKRDCCSDYDEICESCRVIGCQSNYAPSRPCQCNTHCRKKRDCCSDYDEICESCQSIGCGTRYDESRRCHCNKKCRSFKNCCSDYTEVCSGTSTGSNNLAVVLSLAFIFTVVAVIVALVCYLKVRRERAQRLSNELKDRHYYEIDVLDQRTFGVNGQVGSKVNDNWEWNTKENISTASHERHGGGIVRNVAYQSYNSDN